jgi:hypothetical protein
MSLTNVLYAALGIVAVLALLMVGARRPRRKLVGPREWK